MHKLLSAFDNEITKYQGDPELMTKFAASVLREKIAEQGSPVDRKNKYK